MSSRKDSRDASTPIGRVPFAVGLFVTVVAVALLAEVPLATITDRGVSFDAAFSDGAFVGGVFSVIYLLGTVATEHLSER